jgi:alanine racemase
VPRRLGLTGGEVLIGGVRRAIRGVVTMDQTIVEVTGGPEVHPGDPVVLLGAQGDECITAQEWADRLDTIPYEVVCGFSVRLPRQVRSRSLPVDLRAAG